MAIQIRPGTKEDLPQALKLVHELAAYERAPEQVTNTVAMMEEDGFGANPIYGMFVAEKGGVIVGIAIYYYRYSTWKGRRLFLEDLIVTASERGHGIGKMLFDRMLEKCLEDGCTGMMWQVLDWNEPAINFYKRYRTSFDNEWINCSLDTDQIKTMVAEHS